MIALWLATTGLAAGPHVTVHWGPGAAESRIAEVVAADGRVLERVPLTDPRHRSLIGPDGGGVAVTLEQATARVEVPWPDGAHAVHIGSRRVVPGAAAPPAPPPPPDALIGVLESGPADERLDLVFLGDGYPEDRLDKFADDVDRIVDYLLTLAPYRDYSGLFNIWRIDVASVDEGVSHEENAPPVERDTAWGCYYGCAGVERLVCCDDVAVAEVIDALIPNAEGVMVLVNEPIYGGSGGFNYATSYVGDEAEQVAAHELGHTLVGLWDEYSYGVPSETDEFGPNCAVDPEGHWPQWSERATVGAFEECSFTDYYRPTADRCMMRTLQDGYCPICREQVVLEMYDRVPSLVRDVQPAPGTEIRGLQKDPPAPILVETLGPDDGLVHEWSIDGEVVLEDEPDLDIRCSGLTGELTLRVYDPTGWVRSDPSGLLEETIGPWSVRSEECRPPGEAPLSCGCQTTSAPSAGLLGLLALIGLRRRS